MLAEVKFLHKSRFPEGRDASFCFVEINALANSELRTGFGVKGNVNLTNLSLDHSLQFSGKAGQRRARLNNVFIHR
jgi:hypothetical protein